MFYVMSDIHGFFDEFIERLKLIDFANVKKGIDKIILLGDYIDGGLDSFKTLQLLFNMQSELGAENFVVLRGNHEDWFLDFLFNKDNNKWIQLDYEYKTTKTFLESIIANNITKIDYLEIKETIKSNHNDLIEWMNKLPYYYETETQIFVHAGIDEQKGEFWKDISEEKYFVEKQNVEIGYFYKDVIAGHISTNSIIKEVDFFDVIHDGFNHYYIDGETSRSKVIPILVYDEIKKEYKSLNSKGECKEIKKMIGA